MGGRTGLYEVGLPVKVKTRLGYQLAHPGDSIDLAYLTTNSRRGRVGKKIAHTLTTGGTQGCFVETPNPAVLNQDAGVDEKAPWILDFQDDQGIWHRGGIRRLTPRECWRLQGFTDTQFDKVAALGLSDNRLYKMAGNAVTVPVVTAIGRQLQSVWKGSGMPMQEKR